MQIYHPKNIFPIQMPGPDDLAALLVISRNQLFPDAKPLADGDAREYLQQFAMAFQFVSTLRRVDDFQGRLGDWYARAESWHAERGNTAASVSLAPLMCAVLAAGDIRWQAPPDRWPHDVLAGLAWSGGAVATPAWRDVLRTKTCRPMVPVKLERHSAPHPLIYSPGAG
ncbi:hypothetical protein UP09_22560 [Bradyrhizobium sp. LTSP885]|uniref:hypothetical protein n=1 Tax=Bradyrhizobium sp. LTSP885 TaxID=1619232 RepID=UPI0005C9D7F6|nr:hypothetical protein [Bradyrhizobium sp. LTSP885]KJC40291.1 hypothetical protein UP09_22560 [Bradyrhizobium sp. LTSP885]